jgi:hypothetical protein
MKDQILHMIDSYNSTIFKLNKKILIDPEFPEEELITIMKPYLYLCLVSNYSLIRKNRSDAKNELNKKLQAFQNFNPNFGRKIIKFKDIIHKEKIKRVRSHIGFNVNHKPFNNYNIDKFMNNHLGYKYDENESNNNNNDNDSYDDSYDNDEIEHRNTLNSIRQYLNTQMLNNTNTEEEEYEDEQEDEEEEDEEEEQNQEYEDEQEDEDEEDEQEDEEEQNQEYEDQQEDEEEDEEYNDSVS